MSVFVPITDGAQVDIVFGLAGERAENRLWFVADNPPVTTANLQLLAEGVSAWHQSNILVSLSSDLVLAFVVARDWTSASPVSPGFVAVNVSGGVAVESCSANVAVVVHFRWPLNRRARKQNKHFVPGAPESDISLNTVSDALSGVLFEAYVSLIDDAPFFDPITRWRWNVASAFLNGSARSTQLVGQCIGPSFKRPYPLGQRRTRLPIS